MKPEIESFFKKWQSFHAQHDECWKNHEYKKCDEIRLEWRKCSQEAADTIKEITDEVRKEWFKNYGCMNGWSEETTFLHSVASHLHERDVKDHPELHEMKRYNRWRCYEVNACKCGFW